ncbi:MAG TPA: DNA polymerase III subunit beta [Tetrasphaera sp.]|uniref:DNA polymerase III subunit beta n=1 Tax=Nostocoides sp. TaxID=1917966 RepID=UPI002BE56035|nr:DNA polymerase III subunit beta [Tetrasphaera sp.]HNQ08394.1 DNA polymerase III subunit beta [Tetrasphaera sp.]
MKFRVERDVLAEAVTWVARGLPVRPAVPVLAGVLIDAGTDGTVTLSAFDYEVSARITVSAEVSEPGTVLVLGRLLSDISRNLPADKPVDVSTDGSKVLVNCGSSRFALLQMPASDYPTLPTQPESSGTIDGATFTQAVSQVAIAADRGDTLPILTGVRVEIEGEKVTFLATDRYRLAMREFTWNPSSSDASHIALIPAKTLSEMARSLGSGGSVAIALGSAAGGDGLVGFEAGQRHSTSRLLDGEYPKVAKIFPSSSEIEAVVKTADLIEAVKRVALVAERNTPVRLRFSQGQVDIEAGTGDDAQASEAVEARLDGADIDVAFNPAFLLDGLGALHTPYAHLSFTAALKPAMISGQSEEDGSPDVSYRYVLQPVRLTS